MSFGSVDHDSFVSHSVYTVVLFGVPQGSVLIPMLFILLYSLPLLTLVHTHIISVQCYSGDT